MTDTRKIITHNSPIIIRGQAFLLKNHEAIRDQGNWQFQLDPNDKDATQELMKHLERHDGMKLYLSVDGYSLRD